ncbi:MAG: copper resistance protein CopC [Ktedonobacterales bacterium]|nr:copper resistance protein CopC [Ktedonobacterales bacterium]
MALIAAVFPLTPASAHALPVSYDPPPNAALTSSPAQIQIRFSEHLNADISRIVVVNPSNQRVDNGDMRLSADQFTMTASVPTLPAGTYVVAWRTHSADDGHVAGGSYLFHIKRADGTVPPLTGSLPSGDIVGGAGAATNALTGLSVAQAVAHALALIALAVILGLIFWSVFVAPRQGTLGAELVDANRAAFAQLGDIALEVIIVATIIEVALQAVILDGTGRGLIAWPIYRSILFDSRQGIFLMLRVVVAAVGVLCLWVPQLRSSLTPRNVRRVLPIFGVSLAVAFVYSGHGGAGQQWWSAPNDLLHLLANGVWLGGLCVLAFIIFPALGARPAAERWGYLATRLPAFGLPALIAVAFIAVTGPLNAGVRMTSFSQLWTTAYGVVLSIKILLFLVMVGISYVHAFRLRPALAASVGEAPTNPTSQNWLRRQWLALVPPAPHGTAALAGAGEVAVAAASSDVRAAGGYSQQITRLIQFEATIGLLIIGCAALLSPLASTLAPSIVATNSFGATGGNQTLTQTVDSLTVTLAITPGRFGTNAVTIVVKNPNGSAASAGTVFIVATMEEMDMGVNTFNLTAASQPGTYTGTVDLAMAGHWNLQTVIRTKEDPGNLHRTTFIVSAAF